MDGNRFDELSRRFAGGISRRTAVKGAAAAVLGALGLRKAAQAQGICFNQTCFGNPGVCSSDPAGCVCCVYPNRSSRCLRPEQCRAPGVIVQPTTTTAAPTTTTAAPTTTVPPTTTAAPTTTAGPSTTATPTTTTTRVPVLGVCGGTFPFCLCLTAGDQCGAAECEALGFCLAANTICTCP